MGDACGCGFVHYLCRNHINEVSAIEKKMSETRNGGIPLDSVHVWLFFEIGNSSVFRARTSNIALPKITFESYDHVITVIGLYEYTYSVNIWNKLFKTEPLGRISFSSQMFSHRQL
jgi:hypothetical protein